MGRYVATRLGQAAACVLFVTAIVFLLARVSGDPLLLMMPPEATDADYARMRTALGLDRPVVYQYWVFLSHAARGDFGTSIRWRAPAMEVFLDRLPATIELSACALAFAVAFGVWIGVASAARRGGLVDTVGKGFALLGQSVPTFWVGLMLILLFSVSLRVLPSSGRGGVLHLILPALTLGWFSMASITRISRSAMLDVLGSEFITLTRVKGLPEFLVVWKHGLKNASIPIVTVASLELIRFVSGAVVVETVFSWPGVGRLAVDAVYARDYPMVQTIVLVSSVAMVLINVAVDIVYAFLDPRIRLEASVAR